MVRRTRAEAEQTRQRILDAALQVFHERGVSRTTLEQVARAAGLTRGAVYWHFANKTELFFAMREQISHPLLAKGHSLILAGDLDDPLEGIEHTFLALFQAITGCEKVRQMFDIMFLRCEFVDDFAGVLTELNRPGMEFLEKVEVAYRRAADRLTLRPGLDAKAMALDSWCFVRGLFIHFLSSPDDPAWQERIPAMIQAHIALRRHGT